MNISLTRIHARLTLATVGALVTTLWLTERGMPGVTLAVQSPVSPVSPTTTPAVTPAKTIVPTATPLAATGGGTPPIPITWIVIIMIAIIVVAAGIALARRRSSTQK
ncbi:MAG: hypothetical protein J7M34_00040 [Anaerolineae bacterium]|nr:hypothetical protein [Anaerolineae bacterium]